MNELALFAGAGGGILGGKLHAAENKKYDKSRSVGRIDGIVAAVMACGILEEMEEKSVYEGMTSDEIKDRMAF